MKRLFLVGMACLALIAANAVEIDTSNNSSIAAGIKLGSSFYPSFDVEIDIEYRPVRYVGANVGLLLIMPINRSEDVVKEFPVVDNTTRTVNDYKNATYRSAAKAGLQFTTPAVMLSEGEMGLSLRLSPGIIIPFPTNKSVKIIKTETETIEVDNINYEYKIMSDDYFDNSDAKFCYWYGRAELVLELEEQWEFTLGYTYSNFDLYGGARNIQFNDTKLVIADKKPMQNIMIGLTYKF